MPECSTLGLAYPLIYSRASEWTLGSVYNSVTWNPAPGAYPPGKVVYFVSLLYNIYITRETRERVKRESEFEMSAVSNLKNAINVVLSENEIDEISYHMVYNYVRNGRFSETGVSGEVDMTKVKSWLTSYIDKKNGETVVTATISEIADQLR